MTWIETLEQKRTLLVGGVIAICVAALALTVRRKPVDSDSYWHLQTGLDWVHKGLSPWIDHFSFTYAGEAISSQPVIFQALLAWLVDSLGLQAGFQILKLAAFTMAFGLMALFLRKLKSPPVIYLVILPLLTLLLELRSNERPELFSYSFSIIAVMLYHRARGRATMANVLPIALLMLAWTNYHTPILGYVLFFGFFVDAAMLQIRERAGVADWAKWLWGGLLVLGVGFLNPGFHHPLIDAFLFAPEWKDYIQEYRSSISYKSVIGIYSLLVVGLVTLILAAKRQKFGYLVVILIFAYSSARMARLVTPCGIIVLCLLASLLSELDLKTTAERQGRLLGRITGIGVCLVVLTSLYSVVTLARDYMQENRTSALSRPESIVAYMQERQLSGRIFNEYGIGGYLIHALGPDSTVYIDGRTNILYPIEHYESFLNARNDPEFLIQEINKYDITLALLKSDRRAYSVMLEAGVLGLDFVEHSYSLFTRDNPSFPIAGKLLGNPACWDEADNEQLEAEHTHAILNLPGNSSLLPNLGFMYSYSLQSDRVTFLQQFAASSTGNEMQLRFAAYQALSLGLFQVSADLLERIEVWDHREYLSAAMANAQLGHWEKAGEIIDWLTMIYWPHVTRNDTVLLYRILETIRQNRSLRKISDSYVDDLKVKVEAMGRSVSDLNLDVALLCVSSPSKG
jgi:hypothetical protein